MVGICPGGRVGSFWGVQGMLWTRRYLGISRRNCCRYGAGVAIALLLCGLVGCSRPDLSQDETAGLYVRDVSGGLHDTTPVRGERDPLGLHRDGEVYECSMCHEGFEGDLGEAALQGEHSDIVFDHGRNVLCLNCHHPSNADLFVDFGGAEIASDTPTLLCAKCHGPHYREWSLDVHGRVSGFWGASQGVQAKLDCIQCHDPHWPKFKAMVPQGPPVYTRFDVISKEGISHGE